MLLLSTAGRMQQKSNTGIKLADEQTSGHYPFNII